MFPAVIRSRARLTQQSHERIESCESVAVDRRQRDCAAGPLLDLRQLVMVARARRPRSLVFGVHVALPLALGAASYLVLRSWAPIVGAHAALWPAAPRALRDHFADAAWGWALGGFVSAMWLDGRRAQRLAWTLAAAFIAAGWELLQFTHDDLGRFDSVDLVVQTSAVLIAAALIGGKRWMTNEEAR